MSGHDFIILVCTVKLLSGFFVAKKCARCDISEWLNNDPKLNACMYNYKGCSREMEEDSEFVLT